MGMFDNVRCKYPLPIDGYSGREFQTKDTPEQGMDLYEIREDGSLWHEAYDTEDRSDPNAEGLARIVGCATRINQRWEREPFTGEVRFYTFADDKTSKGWVEFSSYFVAGELKQLHLIEHRLS